MKPLLVASLVLVPVLAAGPAFAQVRSQSTSGSQSQAVNPEVVALQTTIDLVTRDLGFSPRGEIVFTLANRGSVAVNPIARGAASSLPPITIDLYMGNALVQSVYQTTLAGRASKAFAILPTSNVPKCKESRDLKVIVDRQNAIPEWSDQNNVTSAQAARPCPDYAIKDIERDYSGLLKETYSPKVTIVNKGNAPAPSIQVWGTSLPTGVWPVTGWPELIPTHQIPALSPGETTSFHIGGSVLSTNHTAIRIILDRHFEVDELDESNNFKDERL